MGHPPSTALARRNSLLPGRSSLTARRLLLTVKLNALVGSEKLVERESTRLDLFMLGNDECLHNDLCPGRNRFSRFDVPRLARS